MGFLLEFDSEFGDLRFWLIWLLGFDEEDDEKEVFLLGVSDSEFGRFRFLFCCFLMKVNEKNDEEVEWRWLYKS